MPIGSDVLASTLEAIREDYIDNLFVKTPWLDAVKKKGGIVPVEEVSGRRMTVPVLNRNHSTSVDLLGEGDAIPLTVSDVLDEATFVWAHNVAPILLGLKSKTENTGDAAKISIWEARMMRVMEQQCEELNQKVISNNKPGSLTTAADKFSELLTFNGNVTGSGIGLATGIFEGVTTASSVNVVGGLTKSLSLPGWNTGWATAAGAFATNGRPQLDLLIGDAEQYSGMKPHMILMSRLGWGRLRASLVQTELYEGAETVKQFGYGSLGYNGVPVAYDVTLANGAATGAGIISAYVLNLEDIKLYTPPDAWFSLGDSVDGLFGGFAGSGKLLHTACALAPRRLSGSAVLVNGDA